MNKFFLFLIAVTSSFTFLNAQQNVTVISRCGGIDTITIPSIADNDLDGMDDVLEQKLLNRFMPTFIQFDNESCSGPALDGTGDSNLVVCHIYPYPQQYTFSNNLDSVLTHPVALVPKKGLVTGLIWYNSLININASLLYGQDCGLAGHTADVEGFTFSLKYIGPDTVAGWMYDTVMQNWMGGMIQTISHEGTLCEQIETFPYKSSLFPNGKDTILISPDKHGNYLTTSGCGASFICNPGCGGIPSKKIVRPVNVGEENAPLVTDLGTFYPAYAGNNPWSTSNFLSANGGNAGAIRTKMLFKLQSGFDVGTTLISHAQICSIYGQCFSTGSSFSDYGCTGSPYNFFGQQLTAPGKYYHTLTSSYGCDSTVAVTLSVFPVSSFSYSTSSCGNYNFYGQQLSASGVYRDTLTNAHGCDSVVTVTLDVHSSAFTSYNTSVCAGNTYNFNGEQLTATGTYTDTINTINGCDSVVQLSLIVDTVLPVTLSLNTDTAPTDSHAIFLNGGNPTGGIYSGTGVTGNLFFPATAGEGAHVITYTYTDSFGCSDTATATFVVVTTGIEEMNMNSSVFLYPNPAHGKLQLIYPVSREAVTLTIYNAQGALQKRILPERNTTTLDVSDLPEGIYTLQLTGAGFTVNKKFVVQ